MKPNDPNYKRQLDVITQIPSNKVDAIDLSGLSELQMAEYASQHERDLRAQIRAFDEDDLKIVADEITKIGWTFTYNALGTHFEKLSKKQETINVTINE
jgi:hypothetical protein